MGRVGKGEKKGGWWDKECREEKGKGMAGRGAERGGRREGGGRG